jgi:Mor family transcriptional regulator
MRDNDERFDTWEEIENDLARQIEKRISAINLAADPPAVHAVKIAAAAVRMLCSTLGGQYVYVPKLARHHRKERDIHIRTDFNGDCKRTARRWGLTSRQIRTIVGKNSGKKD